MLEALSTLAHAFPGLKVALEGMGCTGGYACPGAAEDPSVLKILTDKTGQSEAQVIDQLIDPAIDIGIKTTGMLPEHSKFNNKTQIVFRNQLAKNSMHVSTITGHAKVSPAPKQV